MVRRLVSTLVVTAAVGAPGLGAVAVAVVAEVGSAGPVAAQACRPRLSVSKTSGLAAAGESVTVSGSCFDVAKGVYVAFCVVPPPGAAPSPCGGGVDMAGANGLSHWISSDPPPQGVGLTIPYGPGGTFTVTMRPSSQLNASIDCRRVSCAVVTRNDHTRASDRSQDVIVPVSFAADPTPVPPAPSAPSTPSAATAPPGAAGPGGPTGVEGPSEAAAEDGTATTLVAEVVPSTIAPVVTPMTGADDAGEELAAAPAASGDGGGGGAALAAGGAALVTAVAAGGWLARRGRPALGPDGDGS